LKWNRLAGCLLLILASCSTRAEPLRICHRGTAGDVPENTVAGIRAAIQCGCQVVELDVRTTRDGVPVLRHDARLAGLGPIEDLTLDQVVRFRVGNLTAGESDDESIPELSRVLREFKGDLIFYLDLKTRNVEAVSSIVRRQTVSTKVLYRAYLPSQALHLLHLDPDGKVIVDAAILYGSSLWRDRFFNEGPRVVLSVEQRDFTEELGRFISRSELPWILNFPAHSALPSAVPPRLWGVLDRF
jgi:hypothetical protein